MNLWQELSKTALLGTDRTTLSSELQSEFSKHHIDTQEEPSQQLLEATAILSSMRKAGYVLEDWTMPTLAASVPSTQKAASSKSTRALAAILRLAHEDSIREFLFHLNENGKILPPEYLPELLQQCYRSQELWAMLKPVIGNRGKWLMQQHPEWHILITIPDVENWELLSDSEKTRLLRHLRETAPDQGLELLQEKWETEDLRLRVKLLKELKINCSLADEFFLESCLDAKRKELRTIAVQLLSTLEGAQLNNRHFERAKHLVTIKKSPEKGLRMDLVFMEDLEDSAIRDGLSLNLQWKKGGSKTGISYYLLTVIPLSRWESHFKLSKEELIESFVRSEWSVLLLQAAMQSALTYQDADWMELLLDYILKNQHRARWASLDTKEIGEHCPDAVFNKVIVRHLKKEENLFDENNRLTTLLKDSRHQWDAKLANQFIDYIEGLIKDNQRGYWDGWQFRAILKNAAYRCPPQLFNPIRRRLPEASVKWTAWEDDYLRFLKILKFRKDVIEELERA